MGPPVPLNHYRSTSVWGPGAAGPWWWACMGLGLRRSRNNVWREPGPTPGPPPLTGFRAASLPTQLSADSGSDVFKN